MPAIDVKITGIDELARDIQHAANMAPDEFESGMKKVTNKFTRDLRKEAKNALGSTENITSGFHIRRVNVSRDILQAEFMPEAKGSKGHHWHLQEFGYLLKRPNWKSRAKVIRYSDAGATLGFVPGKLMVDAMLPEFEDYMEDAVTELVDRILKENDL